MTTKPSARAERELDKERQRACPGSRGPHSPSRRRVIHDETVLAVATSGACSSFYLLVRDRRLELDHEFSGDRTAVGDLDIL